MSRIEPLDRLRFVKNIAPQIFESKTKTPRFHIDTLNLVEERYRFTAIVVFRGASKTTINNKAYVSTEIFFNHEPYTQIVSKDSNKAMKFVRDIRKLFEAMMLRGYNVQRGDVWKDDYFEVIIDGHKKCVVEAIGAGEDPRGNTADFQRPTLIVIDDLESKVGKYPIGNKKSREKLANWFDDDLKPGLHPTKGRMIFLGTILHKDSLLNRCLHDPEWAKIVVPIIKDGKSAWASRFSVEEILRVRDSYARRGKLSNFSREYMNRPVADEKVLFKESYFKYFSHVEFEGTPEQREIKNPQKSIHIVIKKPRYIAFNDGSKLDLSTCSIYTTMDVASGSETGDRTSIVTCAYDGLGNRYVLEVKSGYWDPFEKGVYSIETYLTWNPLFFGIEKGGMQNDFHSSIEVLQLTEDVRIPVYALSHGGVAKNTRIGNMQPSFVAGMNWFNASDPNTTTLESQLASFDMETDSSEDDEMDALAYQEKFNSLGFNELEDEEEDEGGLYS